MRERAAHLLCEEGIGLLLFPEPVEEDGQVVVEVQLLHNIHREEKRSIRHIGR